MRIQYLRAVDELQARTAVASGEPGSQGPSLDEVAQFLGIAPDRLQQTQVAYTEQAVCQRLSDLTILDSPAPEEDLAKNEDRALVCAALRRLSPFEAWVICERFGLDELPNGGLRVAVHDSDPAHESDTHANPNRLPDNPAVNGERSSVSYYRRSYQDLGRECGLSVFRLRQVENTALVKLRMALAERAVEGT